MVSPNALKAAREARTESGIDTATMSVLLHEPRNKRIIKAVKQAAITPSLTTPLIAARTKSDWSPNSFTRTLLLTVCNRLGIICLTPSTMAIVEALPVLIMLISTLRTPSCRTTFCCGS